MYIVYNMSQLNRMMREAMMTAWVRFFLDDFIQKCWACILLWEICSRESNQESILWVCTVNEFKSSQDIYIQQNLAIVLVAFVIQCLRYEILEAIKYDMLFKFTCDI